ncbi:hypothetical protein [uncultured Methylobacterium sp.]|jgi:murein DD-endopeptidase MepM/ murein hydrolase activator NlpD|uniref:hypothetical protein n=1 Tax=uncultured Methylobacterium sp. TaxID=157278 RepID=UPI0026357BD1|nr:hypothetical protein [uncultured Methylobacterium sp.]
MDDARFNEMAQAIASLPHADRRALDAKVNALQAEVSRREIARIAKLRAQSSWQVVAEFLSIAQPDPDEVLETLKAAGFTRNDEDPAQPFTRTQAEVDEIVRLAKEVLGRQVEDFVEAGGYLEQAYKAGFEASAEGWNFEFKGQEVFEDERFLTRMASYFETFRADIRESVRTW